MPHLRPRTRHTTEHTTVPAWLTLTIVAGFASAIIACDGRKGDIEEYERDVCACKDAPCAVAVVGKHRSTLSRPQSWFERHFVSSAADRAMNEAVQRAETCASVYRAGDFRCGGESAEECPVGYRCEGIDKSIADGQGDCFRIPGFVAKSGGECGGPDNVGCEPGSTCTKTYRGEKHILRCMQPAGAASSAAVEGRSCTLAGGADDCGPGFFCMATQAGSISSIGTCVKGTPGLGALGTSKPAPSSSASSSATASASSVPKH